MTEIYNTFDQIQAAGGNGVFIARSEHGTLLVHRLVNGNVVDTDADAAWYHRGCKAFHVLRSRGVTPQARLADTLREAYDWIRDQGWYSGPWVRNRLGDWLPKAIHEAHPLRKQERRVAR